MADINARLLQAIDGSAPQHKVRGQNRFEFSEGSDRTLHVKIAGKNGNPLDFEGDKFPVEDKQLQSVINELNKVKSELESIKNGTLKVKNDQLIDKIDALLAKQQSLEDKINSVMQGNAFRTQLTGSYVEKHEDIRAITNTSYNSFNLSSDIMSRYRDIEIYVMNTLQGSDDKPVKVRLAVRPYPEYVSLKFGDVFERISSSSTSAHSEVPYSNALINLKDLPPAIKGVITDDSEYYKRFLGNALRIEYNANAAPTKGEMTIWVIGVK